MRYFVPNLRLSEDLPPQNKLEEKLGGLPWGLKPEQMPVCSNCGKHQSLLAQFVHHPERLNLGAPGRVLLVFQCNNNPDMCPTWEGEAGANACFVLDADELTESLTPLPDDSPEIELEARVTEWMVREDSISVEQIPAFYDDEQHFNLPEELRKSVCSITKLGSVPDWVQSPNEAPGEGWVFVGQLDCVYSLFEEPYRRPAPDPYQWEGRRWMAGYLNFGDAGMGYIFLRYQPVGKPDGLFFWQCS